MREPGDRGTQLGLDKLISNSPSNTPLISSNDGEELENGGNQEPEDALNEVRAPRQRNKEDAAHLTAPSQSTKEDSNTTRVRINFKIWERGNWTELSEHLVDQSDPSEIDRVANKS